MVSDLLSEQVSFWSHLIIKILGLFFLVSELNSLTIFSTIMGTKTHPSETVYNKTIKDSMSSAFYLVFTHMHACTYTRMHTHTHAHVYNHARACAFTHTHTHTHSNGSSHCRTSVFLSRDQHKYYSLNLSNPLLQLVHRHWAGLKAVK